MYRIQGLSNAFPKASTAAANRKIGQLVRINPAGDATTISGDDNLLFFPLIEDFDYTNDDIAQAQVTGVAKVYVEESDGIVAGVSVGPGATGVGVQMGQDGDYILGIALKTPAGDGDYIPVLLAPVPSSDAIY